MDQNKANVPKCQKQWKITEGELVTADSKKKKSLCILFNHTRRDKMEQLHMPWGQGCVMPSGI